MSQGNEKPQVTEALEDSRPPRQPRDMQGLLRFAMELTQREDAPNDSRFHQMEPDRLQFLENAMKSLTVDVVEELEKAVQTIMDKGSTSNDVLSALDLVNEHIDNMDFAVDFCKLGGLKVILPHLNSRNIEIADRSCDLIADICQNNPFCQAQILELNILPQLTRMLTDTSVRRGNRASPMHAISCVVRGNRETLDAFLAIDGAMHVMQAMKSDQDRLASKAAFLLNAICSEYPDVKDAVKLLRPQQLIIDLLHPSGEYSTKGELLITALDTMIDKPEDICLTKHSKLYSKLIAFQEMAKDKSELLETVEHIESILTKCFPNGPPKLVEEDNVDR